jgi:hypothetical protein
MRNLILASLLPLLMEIKGCGPYPEDIFLMEFSVLTIGAVLIYGLLLLGRLLAHRMREREGKPAAGVFKRILVAFIVAFVLNGVFFGAAAIIYNRIYNSIKEKPSIDWDQEHKKDLRMDLWAIEYATVIGGSGKVPTAGGQFHLFIWNYWLVSKLDEAVYGPGYHSTEEIWLSKLALDQGLNVLTFFIFIFVGVVLRKRLWAIPLALLFLNWAGNIVIYRAGGFG